MEAGRNLQFAIIRIDFVAGKLLLHEAIIRLVVVERFDHVIAVAPHAGTIAVILEAVRLGVAHHVEPVLRPAFAVVRRRQQPIDELLIRIGCVIVDERIDLLRRRRQPGKVEGDRRRMSVARSASGAGRSPLARRRSRMNASTPLRTQAVSSRSLNCGGFGGFAAAMTNAAPPAPWK